jgi:protein involved in polysaccharide export with SLBB domain
VQSEIRRDGSGLHVIILMVSLVAVAALVVGCAPNHIGKYNELAFRTPKRVTNEIWTSPDQWFADILRYWIQGDPEEVEEWPGPTAADLRPPAGDYMLGPGDVVRVTIQDLLQDGQPYEVPVRVSEEGNISLPFSYLQDVKAEGYTSRGLERRLAETIKKDGPIKDPKVVAFVMEYRNRTYSILGTGARMPGIYPLQSHDMTLFEAIAQAQGLSPMHEQYMYIARKMTKEEESDLILQAMKDENEAETRRQETEKASVAPAPGAAEQPSTEATEKKPDEKRPDEMPVVTPGTAMPVPEAPEKSEPPEAAKDKPLTDLEELQQVMEGKKPEVTAAPVEKPANETPAETPTDEPGKTPAKGPDVAMPEPPPAGEGGDGWKFENGVWVPTKPGVTSAEPVATETKETISPALMARLSRLGVVDSGEGLVRIIRIDVAAFQGGDPSQNIVMRHGDRIAIGEPPAGEWYINGEISRRGVYSLTGRKITILQAIAAAGGLTELGNPERVEVVRRINEGAEEIIYIDLAKIAKGEAPDLYLQPNDYINVGTDQIMIFLAVLRNAFRATYGFGMVYDQNFADIYPWKGGIHPLFGN